MISSRVKPIISSASITTTSRHFSHSHIIQSNIGKLPIKLSHDVNLSIEDIPLEFCKSFTKGKQSYTLDRQIILKGPKGVLSTPIPKFININKSEHDIDASTKESIVNVSVNDTSDRIQRSMWGTVRALLQNNSIGITEGHLSIVKFVGTGYRAIIEDNPYTPGEKLVALKIGLPFTPKLRVPQGITVSSPSPNRLVVEGIDKQQVKLFAAVIREHKKPEPYKGKGIFIDHETIKLKERKIK
ncbi:mitochondrial 54S ribosomal protein YmL16 [Scheffersomyces coipomensis]|uniref:mitochondrial 54S ribosomal protein YmL16 n=1 Tax=Scheffersomyces coipomensis TaxID=1788519 RepID=UPI00315E00F9